MFYNLLKFQIITVGVVKNQIPFIVNRDNDLDI